MMKTTAEMKIEISNARIGDVNVIIMPDGSCKLELEMEIITQKQNNEGCILIEASKLSLKDEFMKYKPITKNEKRYKAKLIKVIENGIEDFYRPIMDPSFADKEKTKIHYVAGEEPAVGKSYNQWKEILEDSKWCLGTKAQYIAFVGIVIKMLVAEGWTLQGAWNAVCNDSRKLGHYWNSNDAKHELENTGSRKICGFYDLANTYKILAEDDKKDSFILVGGGYFCDSITYPLADIGDDNDVVDIYEDCINDSVVWAVRKK